MSFLLIKCDAMFESTVIVCETMASTTAHPCAQKIEVHKRLHARGHAEIPAVNVRHKQFWALMLWILVFLHFTDIFVYTTVGYTFRYYYLDVN